MGKWEARPPKLMLVNGPYIIHSWQFPMSRLTGDLSSLPIMVSLKYIPNNLTNIKNHVKQLTEIFLGQCVIVKDVRINGTSEKRKLIFPPLNSSHEVSIVTFFFHLEKL